MVVYSQALSYPNHLDLRLKVELLEVVTEADDEDFECLFDKLHFLLALFVQILCEAEQHSDAGVQHEVEHLEWDELFLLKVGFELGEE